MTNKKCEIMENTNEVGTQTEERVVEKNAQKIYAQRRYWYVTRNYNTKRKGR